jgi:hypothetical protein
MKMKMSSRMKRTTQLRILIKTSNLRRRFKENRLRFKMDLLLVRNIELVID